MVLKLTITDEMPKKEKRCNEGIDYDIPLKNLK